MNLFKKKLKIGRRVATIVFVPSSSGCEFKTGKIVAIRDAESDNPYDCRTYAVRFDDGKIDLFNARQLFTEWDENGQSNSL